MDKLKFKEPCNLPKTTESVSSGIRTPTRYSVLFPDEHITSQGKPRLTLNKISSYVNLVFKTETQEEVSQRKTNTVWYHLYVASKICYK